MDMDTSVGTDCGSRGGPGGGGQRGKNWDNCNRTTIKYLIKKRKYRYREGGGQRGKIGTIIP